MTRKKIIALVAVSIIGVFAIWLGIQVAYYSSVLDRGSQVNVTEIREFCHEKNLDMKTCLDTQTNGDMQKWRELQK